MCVIVSGATVPFTKNGQRHGQKACSRVARDRAFCKKNDKGTVGKCVLVSRVTVPFTKNRQRHGRNVRSRVGRDRAFCKKSPKARSESAFRCLARPCLLQKNGKGTVKMCVLVSGMTVPFAKNPQRHGQKAHSSVLGDRAFC